MNPEDAEEYTQALGQIGGGFWRQILLAQRMGVPYVLGMSTREWVDKRLGGYVRLSIPERREAAKELTLQEGLSTRQVADVLGVDHSTIAADLQSVRNPTPGLLRDEGETLPSVGNPTPTTRTRRQRQEQKREELRAHNAELVAGTKLPDPVITYPTIVLDPPWDWGDEGDIDQYGRARPTYMTMPFEDIAALPIPGLSQKDAHIYLWITNRSLPKGFQLLERWGFRYITALTWVKSKFGMGNYFRGSTEHVLFGVKGSLPLLSQDYGTHFFAERPGKHSSKPQLFYEIVEACSPGPWLELFARKERPGWEVWGAEV